MKKVIIYLLLIIASNSLAAQLVIYQNLNQTGNSATCVASTIYKSATVPNGLDNQIKSITLSQGFMATLAENENGTGESFCYVARTSNIAVNLAVAMQDKVSFIRVLPILNVMKKGICTQSNLLPDSLNVTWFYDWGVNDVPTATRDYSLMTFGSSFVTETKIDGYINKPGINSMLSFNEPDAVGQANVLVGNAAPLYKKVLRTGYRMGSPATTEGEWDNWLLDFMNLAKQDNMRVDHICIHWYDWGNWLSTNNATPTAASVLTRFKSYINAVYNLYKKPIWITEFNCNVNRTTQTHLDFMALALPYLETDPRIERYAYFFEDHAPAHANGGLTPLGQLYTNHISTPAITSNIIDTRSASPEIISWNTSAITGGGQSVANFMPTYIHPNLVAVTGLQRGSGTSFLSTSISNGFWGNNGFAYASAAHGADSNKVLTFSVQSTNGMQVSYTTIDSFKIRIASSGPIKYQIDYSLNGATYVPITTITGPPRTTGNYSLPPVDLYQIAALQNVPPTSVVTFRIAPYDCIGNGVFYFGAGTSDAGADFNVTGTFSPNVVLPINLTQFQAQQIDNTVKLSWQTQYENNFSHFLLERSTDLINYQVIVHVMGSGRTSGANYAYDDAPSTDALKYYYRLKSIDLNGKYVYSKILVAHFSIGNKLLLYPTLVTGSQVTAAFAKVKTHSVISIVNTQGKLIKQLPLLKGTTQLVIHLEGIAAGTYRMILGNTSGKQSQQFIIQ